MADELNLADLQELSDAGAPPPKDTDIAPVPAKGGLFTRSMDGWAVDRRWLDQIALNDDKVLLEEGYAPDLELYDGLLTDDVAFSTFQQRRLDVISRDWVVEPGADDAQSVAAADHLREMLKGLPWDQICDKMLHGRWYGYAVGECLWKIGKDGKLALDNIYIPNRAWFAFTNGGELVMRENGMPEGTALPPRKFWSLRYGQSHDGQHYGRGLAHWCYWPAYFKRNSIRFWALFLEKFGMPTMLALFPMGWENDTEKLNKLLLALSGVGTDASVIAPEGVEIKPLEASRSGSGAASYDAFVNIMNTAITRVVLGQTLTSEGGPTGLGSGLADVQERKGLAVAQADSDILHETFNNGPVKWLTEWNFPGAVPPRVFRKLHDEEDANTIVERDKKLFELGWERTDESMKETYGEGYQRKPEPKPMPAMVPGQQPDQLKLPKPNGNPAFAAHDPQPLYIQRKLLPESAKALLKWAKDQGFKNLEAAEELHVTVLYCRTPVDWFKLSDDSYSFQQDSFTVEAGGPRAVEPLGAKGVIVLQFANNDLSWRHRNLLEAGATHGHPNYWPHVTFAMDADGVDLDAVEPYRGELKFGPEIWEQLDDDGTPIVAAPSVQFSAMQLDGIDRLVQAIGGNAEKALAGMLVPVREALAGLGDKPDPQQLRVALLEAMERMDTDKLALALADPMLAVRAAEESGEGVDAVA